MLVVISIIAILAAIAMPVVGNFRKADSMLAAMRQMQDDVERARQLAISRRTTVYMVFCPANFWTDPAYAALPQSEKDKALRLLDKQLAAYTFVTLRSVGDQPGQNSPRYLSDWRTLPEGAIIPLFKFFPRVTQTTIPDPPPPAVPTRVFNVKGFDQTTDVPFPSVDAPHIIRNGKKTWVSMPCIAFDYLGRLRPATGEPAATDEYIPLAKGSVNPALDANKVPLSPPQPPTVVEQPPGNSTNAFTLVRIDWLTGRARLERQEFQ